MRLQTRRSSSEMGASDMARTKSRAKSGHREVYVDDRKVEDRTRRRKMNKRLDSHGFSSKNMDEEILTRGKPCFQRKRTCKTALTPMARPQSAAKLVRKEANLGLKKMEDRPKGEQNKRSIRLESHDISHNGCDDRLVAQSKTSKQTKKLSCKPVHTEMAPSQSVTKVVRKELQLDDRDVEERPKKIKKKRVIRLDPHDISNKRLDDGLITQEIRKDKKKKLNKDIELSKNAQFRAIQPSPSILSYVEDNLLGRRRLIELQKAGYNIELSAPLDNIPFSSNSERERIEDNVFRNKLNFFAAAKASSSFPPPGVPEIAFAGRSNVGKSSLLNSLTRQWGVARTSDKPGHTQTINFFELGSKLCLVDLPGYGFAYAKDEVKDAWEELVKEYVSSRSSLKRVCLLVDTKWGLKPRDMELVHLMEQSRTNYQIVLTKSDLVFPIDVARRAMQIEEGLKANKSLVQPTMMVSSKSGAGIRSLRTALCKIARFAKI